MPTRPLWPVKPSPRPSAWQRRPALSARSGSPKARTPVLTGPPWRGQPQVFPCGLKHLLIPAFRNPGKAGFLLHGLGRGRFPSQPLPSHCPKQFLAAAVPPVSGSRPGKASPEPGLRSPGITRAAHSKRRRSVLRLRRFYAFQALAASGLVWPRGRFAVGGGAGAGATPPYQQHSSGAGATPATSSRMGGGPDGLTSR